MEQKIVTFLFTFFLEFRSDHRERLSISQSMFHAYLTQGVPASRLSELAAYQQEPVVTADTDMPTTMDPACLHLQPPLKLPEDQLRSGAELADQQWSRRQFSVLWAPMPADYQLDDADDRTRKVGKMSFSLHGHKMSCVSCCWHVSLIILVVRSMCDKRQAGGGSGRDGEGYNNADVWLMTHSYTLTPLEESQVEMLSRFV